MNRNEIIIELRNQEKYTTQKLLTVPEEKRDVLLGIARGLYMARLLLENVGDDFQSNKNEGLTFGEALAAAKVGKGFRLPEWNKDVVIRAQFPDEHSKMTAPYLYVESRFGRVPWRETNIELFADNWEVVE